MLGLWFGKTENREKVIGLGKCGYKSFKSDCWVSELDVNNVGNSRKLCKTELNLLH